MFFSAIFAIKNELFWLQREEFRSGSEFHCISLVFQTVLLHSTVPSSLLCWNSRWGERYGHIISMITANLHLPQLWKMCLLVGSTVFVSTVDVFCSWKRGNSSVAMESVWKTLSVLLFWLALWKCWIQNTGDAERAFPKEQAQEAYSVWGSLTVYLI